MLTELQGGGWQEARGRTDSLGSRMDFVIHCSVVADQQLLLSGFHFAHPAPLASPYHSFTDSWI